MANPYDDFCDDDEMLPFAASPRAATQRALVPPRPPPTNRLPLIPSADPAKREAQVNYLQLLCQSLDVVTEVSTPVTGDNVEDTYTELYRNTTNNPIRVQVFAELTTPGCGANLSTTNNGADTEKYDVLSLTANGRTESVGILLLPTMSIWMRNFNTAIPMVANDILRVRIFDPMRLISYANLYPQLKGF